MHCALFSVFPFVLLSELKRIKMHFHLTASRTGCKSTLDLQSQLHWSGIQCSAVHPDAGLYISLDFLPSWTGLQLECFESQIECFESWIQCFKSSGWCFPSFPCSPCSPCPPFSPIREGWQDGTICRALPWCTNSNMMHMMNMHSIFPCLSFSNIFVAYGNKCYKKNFWKHFCKINFTFINCSFLNSISTELEDPLPMLTIHLSHPSVTKPLNHQNRPQIDPSWPPMT